MSSGSSRSTAAPAFRALLFHELHGRFAFRAIQDFIPILIELLDQLLLFLHASPKPAWPRTARPLIRGLAESSGNT